jgi:serine/threonine protein kinase
MASRASPTTPGNQFSSPTTLPDGRLDLSAGPAGLPPFGGRFRFVRLLAAGDTALLLEAYDTLRSSTPEDAPPGQTAPARVALKVFHTHKTATGLAEARTLAALALAAAPNLCTGAVHAALPRVSHLRGCLRVGAGEAHVCLVLDRLAESLSARALTSRLAPPPRRDTHVVRLRKMAVQLASALAHVHACGLVHGQVCPRHVVFDKPASVAHTSMALQLVDFSAAGARMASRGAPEGDPASCVPFHTTPDWSYLAPEAVAGQPLSPAADMWALGILLAEAALRAPVWTPAEGASSGDASTAAFAAFSAACERDLGCAPPSTDAAEAAALDGAATPPGSGAQEQCRLLVQLNRVDAGLSDLVGKLLRFNPHDRLTARDALGHPFLTALDCNLVRGVYSGGARGAASNVARPLSMACDAAAMSSGDDAAMEDAPPMHTAQQQEQEQAGSHRSRLHPKGCGALGGLSPHALAPATGAPLPHTPAVWQPAACGVAPGQAVRHGAGLGTPDTDDNRLHNHVASDGEDRGLLELLEPRLPSSDGTATPVPHGCPSADGGASSPVPVPMCVADAFINNLLRSAAEADQAGPPVQLGRHTQRLLLSPPKPKADTRCPTSAAVPPPQPAAAPAAVGDVPMRGNTTTQEAPCRAGFAATSAATTASGDAPGNASQRLRRASMPVQSKRPRASVEEEPASLEAADVTRTGRGSRRRVTVGHAPSPVRAAKKAKSAPEAPTQGRQGLSGGPPSAPGKRSDLRVAVPPHLMPSSGKRERGKGAAPWWVVHGK